MAQYEEWTCWVSDGGPEEEKTQTVIWMKMKDPPTEVALGKEEEAEALSEFYDDDPLDGHANLRWSN